MLQFAFADETGTRQAVACSSFPVTIGRSPNAQIRLVAPGVWDSHAELGRDLHSGKVVIRAMGEASLLINGARVEMQEVGPGDEIQVGGVVLLVALAPLQQRGLRSMESISWLLLAAIVMIESLLALILI